jgi:hypothetical protein
MDMIGIGGHVTAHGFAADFGAAGLEGAGEIALGKDTGEGSVFRHDDDGSGAGAGAGDGEGAGGGAGAVALPMSSTLLDGDSYVSPSHAQAVAALPPPPPPQQQQGRAGGGGGGGGGGASSSSFPPRPQRAVAALLRASAQQRAQASGALAGHPYPHLGSAAARAAHPGARGPPWRASDEMALVAGVGPGIVGACYPGNFSFGRRGRWVQS